MKSEEIPRVDIRKEGRAIQLIQYTSKDGFQVAPEGREFLRGLKRKIGVIAVAGKYRTGKSFLLNRVIMGKLKGGFGVGSTINACTKGIWVWSEPLTLKLKEENEEFDILIMDSEGIGATDEDQNHDTRIFLLATLLSSLLIYNSVGTIDESAIQNLSLIVNMSKQLQIKANGGGETDPEELRSYFPSFMWILRDFALRLVDLQGNPITSKQYLENALLPQKGSSDSIELKNRIRRVITNVFSERDCCTLVRPLEDEKAIQILQEIPEEKMRPEFVKQMTNFRNKVFKKVRPKKLNGSCISGEMLLDLCFAYTKAFNTGGVPCIENAWNSMCKSQCSKVMENAIETYSFQLEKAIEELKFDPAKIKSANKELIEKMIKTFEQNSIGEFAEEYRKMLRQSMKEKYEQTKKIVDNKVTREYEDRLPNSWG